MKKKLAALLAAVLVGCMAVPALASPVPETAPAFSAAVKYTGEGWMLKGCFADFTDDIRSIVPFWSWDGETFQSVNENGRDWSWSLNPIREQTCVGADQEPLASYLKGTASQFFVRLRITNRDGSTYDTQTAAVRRAALSPLPEGTAVAAGYPRNMTAFVRPLPYGGAWQVTAREGDTWAAVRASLPDTLPVQLSLMGEKSQTLDIGVIEHPVTWRTPTDLTLTAHSSPFVIPDAIDPLELPDGLEVSMVNGVYQLTQAPVFESYLSERVELSITVLPRSARADISLDDAGNFPGWLTLDFAQKPSGASSVKYYYVAEGMTDWAYGGELLDRLAVDGNPMRTNWGEVRLLSKEETPYADYLAGRSDGFEVGIEITGGVFDGQRHVLHWPGDYHTPAGTPEFVGSGGGENNLGSGSGGVAAEGGQRPGLTERPSTPAADAPDPTPDMAPDDAPDAMPGDAPAPQDAPAQSAQPEIDPSASVEAAPQTNAPKTFAALLALGGAAVTAGGVAAAGIFSARRGGTGRLARLGKRLLNRRKTKIS